jgi:hypothetical protein
VDIAQVPVAPVNLDQNPPQDQAAAERGILVGAFRLRDAADQFIRRDGELGFDAARTRYEAGRAMGGMPKAAAITFAMTYMGVLGGETQRSRYSESQMQMINTAIERIAVDQFFTKAWQVENRLRPAGLMAAFAPVVAPLYDRYARDLDGIMAQVEVSEFMPPRYGAFFWSAFEWSEESLNQILMLHSCLMATINNGLMEQMAKRLMLNRTFFTHNAQIYRAQRKNPVPLTLQGRRDNREITTAARVKAADRQSPGLHIIESGLRTQGSIGVSMHHAILCSGILRASHVDWCEGGRSFRERVVATINGLRDGTVAAPEWRRPVAPEGRR